VFNVYYLETVAKWIQEQNFDFVYWNMMHDPHYLSIATLPDNAKKEITNRLLSADVLPKNKHEFEMIADFMNNGKSLNGDRLREEIDLVDNRRNQNLAKVEPEFAHLINYESTS
jgi:hypothetical protein